MAMRQNTLDYQKEYPQAVKAVLDFFYVYDGLTGGKSIKNAVKLQAQLQKLFDTGGFTLQTFKSSELEVTKHISLQLLNDQMVQPIR